jgi:transcriptional antiterminator NusG
MAADSVMKWYVVRAIGGQENKVQSYIETEINRLGLSDFVSQVIVPKDPPAQTQRCLTVNETTRHAGRFVQNRT